MPAFIVCNIGIQAGKNGKKTALLWQIYRKIVVFMSICITGQVL